ncbi:MAG TPA: ATP-binding protein, partial [Gemmatimonadaceae bacterium]
VAFLQAGLDALIGLVGAYRTAIDGTTGGVDLEAVRMADETFDVEYLSANLPGASSLALQGIERVSKIVSALKVFAHPDTQDQAAAKLNDSLENTLVMARNEYSAIADVEVDFGEIPDVVCHAGEINQVFLNLIVNAAHAIGERKDTAQRGKISIRTRFEDGAVVIAIGDTGAGIPDAIRDRIFDPFFTTKDVGKGTGQGLAMARTAVVDRHAGTIHFETEVGVGTTFFVRLPVQGRDATPRRVGGSSRRIGVSSIG